MPDEFRIDQPVSPKPVKVTPYCLVSKTKRFSNQIDGSFLMAADDAEDLVTSCLHVEKVTPPGAN